MGREGRRGVIKENSGWIIAIPPQFPGLPKAGEHLVCPLS